MPREREIPLKVTTKTSSLDAIIISYPFSKWNYSSMLNNHHGLKSHRDESNHKICNQPWQQVMVRY